MTLNAYQTWGQGTRAVDMARLRVPNAHQTLDHGGPDTPTPYVRRLMAEVASMTRAQMEQTHPMPSVIPYDHERACALLARERPWWVRIWSLYVDGLSNKEIASTLGVRRHYVEDVVGKGRGILSDVGMMLPEKGRWP